VAERETWPAHGGAAQQAEERRLTNAREQSVASHEILVALGRAGSDPGQILDTIVERALQLCRARVAQLNLLKDGSFWLSRITGDVSEEFRLAIERRPNGVDRSSLVGRVALTRRAEQILDVLDDPEYGRQDLQRLGGYRTLFAAPMMLDDTVVGVLLVWRNQVDPFDPQEQEVLSSFAVQGAIVLRQVQLRQALETRTAELALKVEQLEALGAVGEAVSSSLDLDEVLSRVVAHAVQMTGTDGGSIMEYDEDDESFAVRAAHGSSDKLLDRLRAIRIPADSTLVGRAAISGHPLAVEDLDPDRLDPHLRILHDDGWRSILAVPILREERMLGALVVRRRTPGAFPPDLVDLLETLAAQSALAIANARLFREVETKSAELEIASRHKSEFLASMSHELRTPLNAVIGFSEVLIDRLFGEINERQEEYLNDIRNSGRHLLELLNEILDLSKVEAGQMELEHAIFSVPTALEYVLSLVRERAAAHRITVRLEVSPEVGDIEGDELRFKQIVLNLVSNAVKFTPDGGAVEIAARRDADQLEVTVKDNGIGIPVEDRSRIFESFQQGGRGAPKEEGTGLGLTLTRRIVALFGGRLWLETEVGAGSTFGFTIPVPVTAATEADAAGRASNGAPIVLLVDDDRASLDLVTAYLADSGARVLRARDGAEALAMMTRVLPAAVVLDIRLPRVDGWEVLTTLKSDPATTGVPVVVATIVDDRPRGLALGASEYLLKPVRREDLLGALRRVGALGAPTAHGAEAS
jgi:signal transduction histidine kinase/ActR/RegA family two-component response regulator